MRGVVGGKGVATAAARMKRMKRASGRRAVEEQEEKEVEREDESKASGGLLAGRNRRVFRSLACERGLLHLNCIISTLIFRIIEFPTSLKMQPRRESATRVRIRSLFCNSITCIIILLYYSNISM